MDETDADLLKLIYTRIGTMLEDASVSALELGGPESDFDSEALGKLGKSVRAIESLVEAAQALQE